MRGERREREREGKGGLATGSVPSQSLSVSPQTAPMSRPKTTKEQTLL